MAEIMAHLKLIVANGAPNGAYGNGYGYWWWGGWWWVWAVIAFFFLVIVFAAIGNYGGYYDYRRGWRRRTTPLRGPASGEPMSQTPVDGAAGWGFAWIWLLIIFIICIAFFGGGHWWGGGYGY